MHSNTVQILPGRSFLHDAHASAKNMGTDRKVRARDTLIL